MKLKSLSNDKVLGQFSAVMLQYDIFTKSFNLFQNYSYNAGLWSMRLTWLQSKLKEDYSGWKNNLRSSSACVSLVPSKILSQIAYKKWLWLDNKRSFFTCLRVVTSDE